MTRVRTSDIDVASVDGALTTTRAVRRRLDLARPVPDELVLDLIDIAEQAPSGGNQGSRRWVVVRDREVKEQLAALYMSAAGEFMVAQRDRLAGSGHAQEQVMASAAHLAEHLAEVPVIVVPTIIGVHDGSGRPGLFDSVIQSVWSFCVAARARGLGTAWTTAILGRREELAAALGVPAGITQIAMIPLAWATGESFSTAPRRPAREVTFLDGYGRTWERGPSDPPRLADGPGAVVEVDVDATPADLWPLVTDISLPANWSEETVDARWAEGHDGPGPDAVFIGVNERDDFGRWEIECFVDRWEPERVFGWRTADREAPGARWFFELEPIAGMTRMRHGVVLGPGSSGLTWMIDRSPADEPRIIGQRVEALLPNLRRVAEGIAGLAVDPPTS